MELNQLVKVSMKEKLDPPPRAQFAKKWIAFLSFRGKVDDVSTYVRV
jgi:hypothetical protein